MAVTSFTFVRGRRVEQPTDVMLGYTEEARLLGFRPGSVLFDARAVPADEAVANALRIEPGTPVLRLNRLRTADDEPLAVQASHLPPPYDGRSIDELKRAASLYQALRAQYGIEPAGASPPSASTAHGCCSPAATSARPSSSSRPDARPRRAGRRWRRAAGGCGRPWGRWGCPEPITDRR